MLSFTPIREQNGGRVSVEVGIKRDNKSRRITIKIEVKNVRRFRLKTANQLNEIIT